jgi:Cupin domain
MKRTFAFLCAFMLVVCVMVTWASPPIGVTPTLIGRGTYERFNVKAEDHALGFRAKAQSPVDLVVRTHDYAPGSTTGWHSHPGPVFITVLEGQVTFYEYDDPTCTPTVVSAGEGYVDTGHGHIGRNETGSPARDVTVIVAPVASHFAASSQLPDRTADSRSRT